MRNARDASDLRPLETTYRQLGVTRDGPGLELVEDRHAEDLQVERPPHLQRPVHGRGSYAHVGNNFALTFHDEACATCSRPTRSRTGACVAFVPGSRLRAADRQRRRHRQLLPAGLARRRPRAQVRRSSTATTSRYTRDACTAATPYARFTQRRGRPRRRSTADGITEYGLHNRNFYVQDSYTRKKLTVNLGVRFDYQNDDANAATRAPAQPVLRQGHLRRRLQRRHLHRRRVQPAAGARRSRATNAGVAFKNFSPRIGFTYDLHRRRPERREVQLLALRRASSARAAPRRARTTPSCRRYVRYPWVDLNGDKFVQANEIVLTAAPLSWTERLRLQQPDRDVDDGHGRSEPEGRHDRRVHASASTSRSAPSSRCSASYIWRKYANFRGTTARTGRRPTTRAVRYTPAGTACPAGARCDDGHLLPADQPDPDGLRLHEPAGLLARLPRASRSRPASGCRTAGRRTSATRTTTRRCTTTRPAAYEDPTNIEQPQRRPVRARSPRRAASATCSSTPSGSSACPASYTTPLWDINVSGFYNSRSGYPFIQSDPDADAGRTARARRRLPGHARRQPPAERSRRLDFRVDKTLHALRAA